MDTQGTLSGDAYEDNIEQTTQEQMKTEESQYHTSRI